MFKKLKELLELPTKLDELQSQITELKNSVQASKDGFNDNVQNSIKAMEKKAENDRLIHLPPNIVDYRLHGVSDRKLKGKLKDKIKDMYGNKCPVCGKTKKLTLDHFFFPHGRGGTFVMKHKNGEIFSNVVVLCEECNLAKSDKNYEDFFTDSELLQKILKINVKMTKLFRKEYGRRLLEQHNSDESVKS